MKNFRFTKDTGSSLLYYGDDFVAKVSSAHRKVLEPLLTENLAPHVERIINRRIEEAKTSRNWNAEHCYKNSEEQWFGSQMALTHLKDELIQVGILPNAELRNTQP